MPETASVLPLTPKPELESKVRPRVSVIVKEPATPFCCNPRSVINIWLPFRSSMDEGREDAGKDPLPVPACCWLRDGNV